MRRRIIIRQSRKLRFSSRYFGRDVYHKGENPFARREYISKGELIEIKARLEYIVHGSEREREFYEVAQRAIRSGNRERALMKKPRNILYCVR